MSTWVYPMPAAPQANIQQVGDDQGTVKLTTGLFTVATVPPGNASTLHLYVSNFTDAERRVAFVINKLVSGGWGKETVFSGQTTAPAHGVADVELHGVSDETLEVVVETAAVLEIAISVDVIETFAADGGTLPLVMIPAGRFAGLPAAALATPATVARGCGCGGGSGGSGEVPVQPPDQVPSAVTFTSGVFDVPQGVAATRPHVDVMLSNFTDQPQAVTVQVNTLLRGSAAKNPRTPQQASIPPRGAVVVPIENVEGLPIEINTTIPISDLGSVLVEASINVTEVALADDSVNAILYFGPTDFLAIG